MQSSLIRFSRSLAPHWLSIAAGAFLLSMFFLIGNLYSSQMELRQNADARLVSIGEARAAEISDFLSERRQAALHEEKYQGQLAYLRLAFFDRNGIAQVDVGASSAPTLSPTGNPAEPSIQIDEKRRLIVASAPVLQKGTMRGAVEPEGSLNLLASRGLTNDTGAR